MVDFAYWFDNVISSCDFVTSTAPHRVWVQAEKGVSSAHDCSEFLEQTLGDLDLENLLPQFASSLRVMDAYEPISDFCHALLKLEQRCDGQPAAEQLLTSAEWKGVEAAARRVLSAPAAQERLTHLTRFS